MKLTPTCLSVIRKTCVCPHSEGKLLIPHKKRAKLNSTNYFQSNNPLTTIIFGFELAVTFKDHHPLCFFPFSRE